MKLEKPESEPRRSTIGDVASLAGVSVGTVSNVINGRTKVSAKRRKKVEDAVKALSFSGSLLAKAMRTQRYPVIGLCIPNATSSNFLTFADLLEMHVAESGYELTQMITRHDPARETARIERLIASRASGVFLLPTRDAKSVLKILIAEKMPTVVINQFTEDASEVDQVKVDHRSAFHNASEQLLEMGYDTLIVATQFPNFSVVQQNLYGIQDALDASDRDARMIVLKCGDSLEDYQIQLSEAMQANPGRIALIASSSLLAAWSLEACRALGIRIPEDVGLLSAEEPDWATAMWPTLSCIQQPTRELASIAWNLLNQRISGSTEPPVNIRCDARVNFRSSVKQQD